MDWLRERLAGGPISAKQVKTDAKAAGHFPHTLRRAKEALGVFTSMTEPSMPAGFGDCLSQYRSPILPT